MNGIIIDERSDSQPNAPLWKLLIGDETMAIWSTKIWPQTPWVDPQPEGLKAWASCGSGCLYELVKDPSERHVSKCVWSVCMYVCMSIYVSVYLSVCLSIYL